MKPEELARLSLEERLEQWFYQLGSDDAAWWAKEIYAYLRLDPNTLIISKVDGKWNQLEGEL